jgi:transcriptional regulator with XRE-family HTH domain
MSPGERVTWTRRRRQLSQDQLAARVGVSIHTLRKYENGQRYPSWTRWLQLAEALRVDVFTLSGLPVHSLPEVPGEHPALPAVRAALLNPVPEPGEDDGEDLAVAVEHAYDTWHSGNGDTHARVGAVLPHLVGLARAGNSGDATVGAWLLLRAWSKWVGAHDLSLLAAQRGVDAATGPAARAAAAWNTGMTLSTRGLTEESAQVARAGIRAVLPHTAGGGDPLALLGALHLLLAVESARLADEHTTLTALDDAARIAGVTGETNAWRTVFGPTNVEIYRTATELELCRAGAAVRHGSRVDVSGLPSAERRFAHPFALARAHLHQRDDLAAAVLLRRAAAAYPMAARTAPQFRGAVAELVRRESAATRDEVRPLAVMVGIE